MVEPFELNYQDLVRVMEEHHVLDRTTLLHGACTDKCKLEWCVVYYMVGVCNDMWCMVYDVWPFKRPG